MDARGSSLQTRGVRDLHGLPHGLFQTSTDRAQLRAAVYQVFGGQPWGGCCSDKLLETLLEAGQRTYLKQQLYWDFQLLDSDHDGYLSVRDAELLLAQVPHAYATGEAWQDFLRSRGPGVAWRDIEDWLFRAIPLPVDEPRVGRRRGFHLERGASAGSSTSLYRWGMRSRTEQPLERWDSGAPATLLGEEPSGVLAAVERKYRALQRKLCAEMLQAHYGQSAWASLPQNMKEDKLLELELLVDCGLRKGSVLSLACLPGARLNVRSGAQAPEGEGSVRCVSPSAMEGTAAQALEELRRRKQVETAALLAQQHLLVGSNPEASRRLLHLHAQTALVQQEASFQAALLITELFQGERFWDSQPIVPEVCHQELAQSRLAVGRGSEPAWREAKTVLGRSMTQVLLDRLLLQHERDRASLVQILLTMGETETMHEQAHGSKQLVLPGAAGCREDTSPALQEAIGQMLSLAQKRLEVAGRAEVPWQDCAVAVLVDLQLAQEEELRQTIEDLVGIISGWEGEVCPALYEKLLARLQEPLLMSLIRHQQPIPLQEKHTWEPLKMGPGTSVQELSPGELETQKMLQRGDGLDGPQEQNKMESQGPLLKKLKTCEHQDGGEDSEDHQNSVAPQVDQNLTEDQQRNLEASLLQTKSKSWGPPEFVRPQVLLPKELRNRANVLQTSQASHNLGGQCKEGFNCQARNDSKCLAQEDVRETTDRPAQISPKKELLAATEPSVCQASRHQEEKDPEFSDLQESLVEKSKSLDPQVLSRPWCSEDCRPLQREEEKISGLQDGEFPRDCQPERCQETKSQETLQHHQWPGSEEKAVQVPHREPDVARSQDRQEKIEVSCPQELRNTKACQTEPFYTQEKPQRNLSRPQAMKPCKKAKKEPEAPVASSRKTKSVKSKEMSRSQGMIPLENIRTQGMPEGRPQDFLQREPTQGRRTPEKKSLGTIPEQKEESQNHYENLQRKSKSLEPRRPPAFPSQELKAPFKDGRTQMGSGVLEPKERREAEDFPSQKQRQKPQSDWPIELLQKQGAAQQGPEIPGPQTTKAKEDFPPEEKTRSRLSQSQEAETKKSKPPDSRESHKKKDLETIQDQGTAPQKQKGMLQVQEYGRPESPPLLWSLLWQKAKSFDVGTPYVFPIQKLRKLEEALTHGMPQKMKGAPTTQLQIQKLQGDERPESPPLLWRILWQKSKSFELRKSCAFETQELRGSLIVQLQQGGSQVEAEGHKFQQPKTPREAAHPTQRTRKVEAPQAAQGTPQVKTRDLEEMPRLKDAGGDAQEQRDPQPLQPETQRTSEQDRRDSETPPLLWRVLGMKAKSFELRRPGPRAFRAQRARKLEPSFLASPEMKRLEMTQQRGGPHVEPESQKHGGPKIHYPQEQRDLGSQRHQTISQGGNILPQGSGLPQLETQPDRRSPETPPLMWWVLEMGRQGMPHGMLNEEESVLLQDPQDTSSGQQNTSGNKERKDLETSLTQEKGTEGCCNPYDPHHCHVSPSQEQVGPGSPQPMKAQGMLGSDPEGLGCSDPLEGEKIKTGNCPASETPGHNKTDSLLPPGKVSGKSKSLDFRELCPPKPPELRELESPEGQGGEKDPQAQEDPQMKFGKLQQPKDPQDLKAQERSDPEGLPAQGTKSLPWPQGQGGEVLPSPQSSLQLKPVELMEAHVLPPQELVVLHVQGTLQVDPEALKSQRHVDPKAICPQGHQEAGSSGGEIWVEEKPREMVKNLQICLAPETTHLQADLLWNSMPVGVQEPSKPCSFQIQEKDNQAPDSLQVPEDQALKGLETFAPQVTTPMVVNPLQDARASEAKNESPVQKEPSNQEISQPQEEIEGNEPGAPNSQGYTEVMVLQLQEKKETEDLEPLGAPQMEEHTPLSFEAMNPKHTQDLQVDETQPNKPEIPEVLDHGKPSTWLYPGYSELWEFWKTLGKSKSLDLRELRALQLEALGEVEFSRLQDVSRTKIWQPQRKAQNDPVDVHSKFLPIHERILKDQAARQPQERGGCEVQKPQLMGLEPLQAQDLLSNKNPSQELEDAQIFCPKKCGVREAEEEPIQVPGGAERQPEAAEPQELVEPKLLTPQENRDVESPPLLKGLLRKSKTVGPETLRRRDAFQVQDVRKIESRSGCSTPKTWLQGQGSHNIQGPSKKPQETPHNVEGTLEPSRPEKVEFQREHSTMAKGMIKPEGPLPVDCDIRPEGGEAPFTSPEPQQALPPHQEPQFGNKPFQELERLQSELETHQPQEWKEQEAICQQETRELFESEGQGAVQPQGVLKAQVPQHPAWPGMESHQLAEQKIPEAPATLQGLEEDQGSCPSPGILKRESGSRGSQKLEAPQTPQRQDQLPETSPVVAVVRVSHPTDSQEFRDPAIFCPQESPEIGWASREGEGKAVQTDLGRSELQEHYTLTPQGTLQWKSKSLDPQELSRTGDFQGQRGEDNPHAQPDVTEPGQETTGTRKPPAVMPFSPPSPGRDEEELVCGPAALSVGTSRESSSCEAQPGRASGLSLQPPEEGMLAEGEGGTEPALPETQQAQARQLPSPRPPRREKAFIWLSRQEQEEALRQLAELRAEGELRHRRDKERQILRFQEKLSIARHRKSEDDLLGSGSAERWTPPTGHQGQDQAGQKTAVKRHLEKVKRERTYVMQSKRERNTLRFKELLDPLVTPGEESPEPGQPGGE